MLVEEQQSSIIFNHIVGNISIAFVTNQYHAFHPGNNIVYIDITITLKKKKIFFQPPPSSLALPLLLSGKYQPHLCLISGLCIKLYFIQTVSVSEYFKIIFQKSVEAAEKLASDYKWNNNLKVS